MGKERAQKKGTYRRRKDKGYLWVFGLLAAGFVALWGWSEWARPQRQIPGLETFAQEGKEHVDPTTAITYQTDPPTSGRHYAGSTKPGFYTDPQPAGALVHSLEHGQLVIYYDPEGTPTDVLESLKAYASKYPGEWDGVVVTPRQQEEEVVLTAWRQILRLKTWSKSDAEKFIDIFRGRGPENIVR